MVFKHQFIGLSIYFVDAHQDPDVSNRVAAPVIAIKKISDDEDDYLAYLKGDKKFLAKYKNEHQQFKAAEKLMQKHHHDKISNVSKHHQQRK